MPRPRRRALGLVAGAAILFFLGTNVQAGWLFVIAACLLGTAVAGLLLPARMVRTLSVDRHAPQEVHQGDEARVDLGVTNTGRSMRLALTVEDAFLGSVTLAVPSLRPGERVEIATMRRAVRRGPQADAAVMIRSSAPFGVAERRRVVGAEGAATLVLPMVVPLGPLPFVRPSTTSDRALHSAPRRGLGPEYLGIREYRTGDSMRHVHWASTARTGALMVREFEQEETRRLAIVVDASWDRGDAWTPFDRICAVAASVALAALAQGQGTRLIVPGARETEVLARTDGHEILRHLAHLRVAPDVAFADALSSLDAELRGVETVVLAFAARRGNPASALAEACVRLREIASVVAIPVEVTREEASKESLPAGGWMELEERLRAAGADVFPWRSGDDLSGVLTPEVAPA